MTIGQGIAIAAIWAGVGLCGIGGVGDAISVVAIFAMIATVFISLPTDRRR